MNFTDTFCVMKIFSVPGSFRQYVVHMEHSAPCGAELINIAPPENGTVMHIAQREHFHIVTIFPPPLFCDGGVIGVKPCVGHAVSQKENVPYIGYRRRLSSFIRVISFYGLNTAQNQPAETVRAAAATTGRFAVAFPACVAPGGRCFMKTNAPCLFFVDKESGVSFYVFHVLSVSFSVTAVSHMKGECNIQNLTENVPFVGTGDQSCIQVLCHSSG